MNSLISKVKSIVQKDVFINLLIVLIVSVFFFTYIYMKQGILYGMNDDIALRGIASGTYLGEPSNNMIFSVFPFNQLLVWLYKITPVIDWYGAIIIGSNTFFPMCVAYYLIKRQESKKTKIFLVACLFAFLAKMFSMFFVDITFTATSILIAACCLVLFLQPKSKVKNAIIILGFLLSYGMRPTSCYVIMALLLPAWLYKGCHDKGILLKDFILLAKIGVCIVICMVIQNVFIVDKYQRDYMKYNEDRSLFYDYYLSNVLELPEEEQKEIFEKAGLDDNQREMLCTYGPIAFYEDVPDKMGELIHQIELHGIKKNSNIIDTIKDMYLTKCASIYFCVVFFGLFFFFKGKDKKKMIIMLFSIGLQTLIMLYLAYNGRIPDRVIMPLFMSFSIFIIAMMLNEIEPVKIVNAISQYDKILTCLGAIIILGYSIRWVDGDLVERENCVRNNLILTYFSEHQNNLYLYDRNSLETVSVKNKYMADNYLNMSGWTVFSGVHAQKITKYRAESYRDLLFKDNVYIVTNGTFEPSVYGLNKEDIVYEVVDQYEGYTIYNVNKK